MGQITDIGRRVELVPMDGHCHDISIALYLQQRAAGPAGLVHTYSSNADAPGRIAFVAQAMAILGGLETDGELVRFPCGTWHAAAARRLFLEACKLESSATVGPRPLEATDARTGQGIRVEPLGEGRYRVLAEHAAEGAASRAPAVAAGLAKLAELAVPEDEPSVVAFPCGEGHDALVGLLLPRALNVRQTLREQEALSSRGVLSAPSASQEG
jgi:hypothetical protein